MSKILSGDDSFNLVVLTIFGDFYEPIKLLLLCPYFNISIMLMS